MTKEINEKYYNLIVELIKSHRKFPGYEAILDDIAQDVCEHAKTVIQTVTNEDVITSYLTKVVSTSIITVPKKMNFNNAVKHRVITTTPLPVEAELVEDVVLVDRLESALLEENNDLKNQETLVQQEKYEPADKTLVDLMINGVSTEKQPEQVETELTEEIEAIEEDLEELDVEDFVAEELNAVVETTSDEPEELDEIIVDSESEAFDIVEELFEEETTEEMTAAEILNSVEELEPTEPIVTEIDEPEEIITEVNTTLDEVEVLVTEGFEITEELEAVTLEAEDELLDEPVIEEQEPADDIVEDVVEELVEEASEELEAEAETLADAVEELEASDELLEESVDKLEVGDDLIKELEEELPLEGFDNLTVEVEFKAPSFEAFSYEPKFDDYNDEKEINDILKDLDRKNPDLDIVNVCKMKFEESLSVNKIAEKLNMEVSKVIEALNEIVDELKD